MRNKSSLWKLRNIVKGKIRMKILEARSWTNKTIKIKQQIFRSSHKTAYLNIFKKQWSFMKRWGVFNSSKNLQLNSVAWHGPSSFLQVFLCCCLIYSIEKENIVTKSSLNTLEEIQIFTSFRLELNLTIYLTLPYGQAFSLLSSSLCFFHILNTLLSVNSNSTEFHSYHFSHCHKPWRNKKISFTFVVVVVVMASAYSTKRIYIDKSTTFSKPHQLFMTWKFSYL